MGEDIRRLRAACDRCHSQKVRCPKKPDEENCSRCIKAKAPCNYSPFREKKFLKDNEFGSKSTDRQAPTSKEKTVRENHVSDENRKRKRSLPAHDAVEDNHADNLLEWPLGQPIIDSACPLDWSMNSFSTFEDFVNNVPFDLGFDGQALMMPIEFEGIVPRLNEQENIQSSNSSHSGALYLEENPSRIDTLAIEKRTSNLAPLATTGFVEEMLKDCIRDLSKLSIDLLEHRQTIPPQSIHDENLHLDQAAVKNLSKKYANYEVADTMCLTEKLINIYPNFIAGCVNLQSSRSTPVTTPPMDLDSPNSGESTSDGGRSSASPSSTQVSRPALDHASIMLIISCHLRLIDIYDELFAHMAICVSQKGVARTQLETCMDAPQLKIGSYAPPQKVAVPMQILLLVQFASQLFDHAATLAAEIRKAEPPPLTVSTIEESMAAAVRFAADNVKSRASHMSQEIKNVKRMMIQEGFFA